MLRKIKKKSPPNMWATLTLRRISIGQRNFKFIKVLRNKWTPLQIVITNGYTCSIFQVAKITKKGV